MLNYLLKIIDNNCTLMDYLHCGIKLGTSIIKEFYGNISHTLTKNKHEF